jgi:flagellar motility protein MotE (MotC chaperone)
MKFLQSSWVICLIGCAAYLGTTLAVLNPKAVHPVHAQEPEEGEGHGGAGEAVLTGPSWDFNNPEVDQIIAELRAEKASLADRERQLNELSARLRSEQREMIAATQNVHRLQAEFDRNVTRVREEETANLKRLAKLYATMSPDGAAAVMRNLEDDQMLKILVYMKEVEIAPILELIAKGGAEDAKRVAGISERLRLVLFRQPAAVK